MTLDSGTRLGPYEILSRLGAGGMGEVYRARDTRLGRDVAVKVLARKLLGTPEAAGRFEREARAVAALSHPNILTIFDIGEHEGAPYAVTELLEGESLGDRLRRSGATSPREAARIALAIAEGLAVAHAKGIIHRDIKPDNVFLTSAGGVKVLDFGLARLEGAAEAISGPPPQGTISLGTPSPGSPVETMPGALLGTIHYMSPEQVRGLMVDARSDIFSVGCVLYEMVAGRRPFARATVADTMVAIIHEMPTAMPGDGCPAGLEAILFRCLEKMPDRRFQSAQDLGAALRALAALADGAASGAGASASNSAWNSVPPPTSPHLPPLPTNDFGGPPPEIPGSATRTALDDFKEGLAKVHTLGVEKGTEALRRAADRIEKDKWLGAKSAPAAERLRAFGADLGASIPNAAGQNPPREYAANESRRGGQPRRGLSTSEKRLIWIGGALVAYAIVHGIVAAAGGKSSFVGAPGIGVLALIAYLVLRKRDHPESRRERRREKDRHLGEAPRNRESERGPEGASEATSGEDMDAASPLSQTLALILSVPPMGIFGFHRFYTGKIGTGILFIFTGGGFGIWWLIDLIMIACGEFTDAEGRYLQGWD